MHLLKYYNAHCSNKPGEPLTIYNVAEIVGKSFPQAFTAANILKGFKTTGIWPFNRGIFTDADFLAASVTDRPFEDEDEHIMIHQYHLHPLLLVLILLKLTLLLHLL